MLDWNPDRKLFSSLFSFLSFWFCCISFFFFSTRFLSMNTRFEKRQKKENQGKKEPELEWIDEEEWKERRDRVRFSSLLFDCNAGCLWKFRVCTSFSASYSSSSSTLLLPLLRRCSVEESELRVPSSSRLPSSTSLQSSLLMSTFLLSLFDVSSHLVYSFSCFVPSFRSLAFDRSTLFFLFLKAVHSIVYCSTPLGLLLVSVEDGQERRQERRAAREEWMVWKRGREENQGFLHSMQWFHQKQGRNREEKYRLKTKERKQVSCEGITDTLMC